MASGNREPQSIESDLEQTRERLAETIDQLVYRAKPSTITQRQKNKVKAVFVDDSGEPRQDNIIKVAGSVVGLIVLVVVLRKVVN